MTREVLIAGELVGAAVLGMMAIAQLIDIYRNRKG